MNPQHVEIVRQGADAIATWRNDDSDERLDLSGADLFEANLVRAELFGANLSGADLFEANLSGADLFGADLSGADLFGADLFDANLIMANLLFAVFSVTELESSQFKDAKLGGTVLANCDLSSTLGLEAVRHSATSTIGLDTIVRSGGNIPETFLRGAGVPDTIITYVRSLVAEPIQFYTCFISYAAADQAFADRLYADLQAKGVRCWYFPETSVMGRRVWEDIDRSIKVYDKLVVICSERSLTSPAVQNEIEQALGKEDRLIRENAERVKAAAEQGVEPKLKEQDVLFPIRIDGHVFDGWNHRRKIDVTSRTIGDFTGWDKNIEKYNASLGRLLHGLDPNNWPQQD